MTDVQGRCPACGGNSLFLADGGHVTCSRLDCPNPSTADDLLHGGEAALAQVLGNNRPAQVVAHTLHFHGHSLADVRRMTDEQLLAVPGIGETSLARIRAAIPAPEASEADELAKLREGLHKFRYALDSRAGRETTTDFIREMLDATLAEPGEPCDRDEQYARAEAAEAEIARLRAGEEPSWDAVSVPTPGQWVARWNAASAEERLEVAQRVIEDSARAARCFEMAHENHIARCRVSADAQAALARVRAESARIRSITPTWAPVADLIDAALDGPARPREQRERPTHPDGTPYRCHEIKAEGWGHCDGCRMWTTATPERPHQCTQTYIHGPIAKSTEETIDE
ncbi:hypothetical protein [Streptomyces sp. NPDC006610]|uniref:hypothetical protein n=1 Tax=Streptomyces sp. NPDC006610 TaxID=3154584 RepID=UPI0033AF6420